MISNSTALYAAGISGIGAFLPERIVTNDELAQLVETNDEWIRARTGIAERRIAAPDQTTCDLAEGAARAALGHAGIEAAQLDLVIVATSTPDYPFPSTASLLQHRLGAACGAFDMGAACAGFTYALVTAAQFVRTGAASRVLVVGAETLSRVVDWSDRNTCILFGDGAGAVVVERVEDGFGMLGFDLGSDGSGGDLLKIAPYEVGREIARLPGAPLGDRRILQSGREVYKFAVNVMGESAARAVKNSDLTPEDIDLMVPHQANRRIIDSAAQRLHLPPEKVVVNLEKYGNTSAATIPIALAEADADNRMKRGDNVVMVGFGGGLSWASCVMKWS